MTEPETFSTAPRAGDLSVEISSSLTVTALLVVQHGSSQWLERTLPAVLGQHRPPDRLVLVDATPGRRVRDRLDAAQLVDDDRLSVIAVPPSSSFAAVIDTVVEALPGPGEDKVVARRVRHRARPRESRPADRREWLWLLHEDTAPALDALARLVQVVGRSDRIGVAGCKVLELERPDRLVNVGLDLTRTGRHVGLRMQGEYDQGQHDGREDVLGVSSAGMLLRRDVYLDLGGFDPAFDGDGDGLDLCWRTHLLGLRVVVVPTARVHQDLDDPYTDEELRAHDLDDRQRAADELDEDVDPDEIGEHGEHGEHGDAGGDGDDGGDGGDGGDVRARETRTSRLRRRDRARYLRGDSDRPAPQSPGTLRRHRQVALARCGAATLPLQALWTAFSCTVLALLLLLVKRPRRAVAEAAQATAPLGLTRVLGARSRFAGRGTTRRRDLDGLFVPVSAAAGEAFEAFRDAISRGRSGHDLDDTDARLESGPGDDEVEGLSSVRATWPRRLVTHAGTWMTIALVVATAVMWRPLLRSGALLGDGTGLQGGELRPFGTDAWGIWRQWRDAWGGPGLGQPAVDQPYLPLLAALARLVELLPWVDDARSGATAVTWLLVTALPLAGISAYVAGRVATLAAWPRAAAGLVWAGLATLTTGVADGRLGPVVGHVLLPLVLAGTLAAARRGTSTATTFATALAAAVMGAFAPVLLLFTTVAALGVLLLAPAWGRLRALILLLGPWGLLLPWTVSAVPGDWRRLLAGPGALLSGEVHSGSAQRALLHPGGPGSYLVALSIPLFALALLSLLRGRPQLGRVRAGLVALGLLGLVGGLLAPGLTLTRDDAAARSPWSGLPLDVLAACLIALALIGWGQLFRAGHRPRRRSLRALSVGGLVLTLGWALAVVGLAAWQQPVRSLTEADDPMPAVVRHMADGPRAVRMLTVLTDADGDLTYRLDGQETGAPARDLELPVADDSLVAAAVGSLLSPSGSGDDALSRLDRIGVGYVGVEGSGDRGPVDRALSGVAGLSPMASNRATSLWRVEPPAGVSASRVALREGDRTIGALPVTGPHGRSGLHLGPGSTERVLRLAEGSGWSRYSATATIDGEPLRRLTDRPEPTYAVPEGGGDVLLAPGIAHPRLRWVQLVGFGLTVFLAVPFGSARPRRSR